jgi:hypothetical protein
VLGICKTIVSEKGLLFIRGCAQAQWYPVIGFGSADVNAAVSVYLILFSMQRLTIVYSFSI